MMTNIINAKEWLQREERERKALLKKVLEEHGWTSDEKTLNAFYDVIEDFEERYASQ